MASFELASFDFARFARYDQDERLLLRFAKLVLSSSKGSGRTGKDERLLVSNERLDQIEAATIRTNGC